MNMDDLQKAIEMLDDDIIFETEKARNGKIKNKKLTIFMKYG